MQGLPPSVRLLGIGFYFATCIVMGVLAGRELDQALDTNRVFTIAGLALGLVLAIWGGIKQLMDVLAAINSRRTEGKG
jgi:hypothetical protein